MRFGSGFFQEFVVDFGASGLTVAEANRALLERGIFGGHDLSTGVPGPRPVRALLRQRAPHPGRHRRPLPGAGRDQRVSRLRRYHAAVWDEPLMQELARPGARGTEIPPLEPELAEAVGDPAALVPESMRRSLPPDLPELSEPDVLRHYLHLSQETLGMMGVSLFGTCTMKYNPRLTEALTRQPFLSELHPLQDDRTLQGVLEIVAPAGAGAVRVVGHGAVRVPARGRRRRRLPPRLRHPRLPRRAGGAGPARRDHHLDPGAPLQPRHRGRRRLQGRHAAPGGERLPVARRRWRRRYRSGRRR